MNYYAIDRTGIYPLGEYDSYASAVQANKHWSFIVSHDNLINLAASMRRFMGV